MGTTTSSRIRGHVRSNAIGYLALFLALTVAPAWGAKLAKNSVGSKQIRNGQVKSIDVADNGLTGTDVNESTLNGSLGTLSGLKLATSTTPAGGIQFGSDTALYREGPNLLSTPDALSVGGQASFAAGTVVIPSSGGVGINATSSSNALTVGDFGDVPAKIYADGPSSLTIDQGVVQILGGLIATQGVSANNGLTVGNGTNDAALGITELTSAPSGIADQAIIYAIDNGSGKTKLMVQFGSGAAQQLAIQP